MIAWTAARLEAKVSAGPGGCGVCPVAAPGKRAPPGVRRPAVDEGVAVDDRNPPARAEEDPVPPSPERQPDDARRGRDPHGHLAPSHQQGEGSERPLGPDERPGRPG